MDLWRMGGQAPLDRRAAEVVISGFAFTPLP